MSEGYWVFRFIPDPGGESQAITGAARSPQEAMDDLLYRAEQARSTAAANADAVNRASTIIRQRINDA